MPIPARRAAAAITLCALAMGAAPALAQSANTSSREAVNGSSRAQTSSADSFATGLSLIDAAGSADFPALQAPTPVQPRTIDDSITRAEVVDRQPSEYDGIEAWTVASPAMARTIKVLVRPAAGSSPAPMLYLLDGVDSRETSGWITQAHVQDQLADDNVTLIMPTGAEGSVYADWYADDPSLGRSQWETFVTAELLPLLQQAPELNYNGHSGIGGLSMGAAGAVMIANRHPELFDAVFGISGCYSASSPVGYQTVRLTVGARGGSVDNLFGPESSGKRAHYDTQADPEGLRNLSVYLSAAEGAVSSDEAAAFDSDVTAAHVTAGVLLEQGAYACTRDLNNAMISRGMTHQKVGLYREGLHTWRNFTAQLQPAWQHIKPALY